MHVFVWRSMPRSEQVPNVERWADGAAINTGGKLRLLAVVLVSDSDYCMEFHPGFATVQDILKARVGTGTTPSRW